MMFHFDLADKSGPIEPPRSRHLQRRLFFAIWFVWRQGRRDEDQPARMARDR